MTDAPTPAEKAARRAMVWSFFVPPVGLVLGWLAYRKAAEDEGAARGEALGAMVNSAFGLAVLVVAIIALPPLYRWAMSFMS